MAEKYQLVGPDLRPISSARLRKDVATPTLSGVRQVISGHPAEGLTPARLARIHRAAAHNDPEAYLELAEDIEERDLHYMAVLGQRRRQVAQLPITVDAATDDPDDVAHKDFIDAWVQTGALQAALFDMMDAIGKGFSVLENAWEAKVLAGRLSQVPKNLVYKPQRWFQFDREDGETIRLRDNTLEGQDLAAHKFVVHRHKNKSGSTIRSGLARLASWAWMYKAFTLRDWAIFVQNYGAPIRIGKDHASASEDEKQVLWEAVSQIAGDCAAIIPDGMMIDFIEIKDSGKSQELYEKRCDWLDRQISKAVLGQTTTTDAVSGGHAVAKEHRLVQEDIEDYDAGLISAALTAQLVPWLIALNFGPQDRYPTLRIGRPEEIPLEELAAAMRVFGPQGLTVEASVLRDRMGWPEPEEGAEVVGGRPKVAKPPASYGSDGGGDTTGTGEEDETDDAGEMTHRDRQSAAFSRDPKGDKRRDDDVHALIDRAIAEADPAMEGMVGVIRAELNAATSLSDFKARMNRLDLDDGLFAAAMTRAMSLAHLAGEASFIDDLAERE